MAFNVTLTVDESELLTEILSQVNTERAEERPPKPPISSEEYIQNIVSGWFQSRIRDEYVAAARRKPIVELRQKLGDRKDL